ncbi:hypothetical protein JIN85_06285 [Luteolibacter pohnpeiensis]|uniref:Lipoprotein chaperone n=1 Tax=Luteolibacter pohnpeiensis TaxID=454153 RepID=A0A934S675_9BACT|nr:hypothetical protein [Luteolibacter pohnpeiensis]MBK1882015.1 hypothetical protein [Luteolibacter pohnpeiensis]
MNTIFDFWRRLGTASILLAALVSCSFATGNESSQNFGKLTLKLIHKSTDGTGNATLEFFDGSSRASLVIQEVPLERLISPDGSKLALPTKGGTLLIVNTSSTIKDVVDRKVERSFQFFARTPRDHKSTFKIGVRFDKWKSGEVLTIGVAEPDSDKLVDVLVNIDVPRGRVSESYLQRMLQIRDFDNEIELRVISAADRAEGDSAAKDIPPQPTKP